MALTINKAGAELDKWVRMPKSAPGSPTLHGFSYWDLYDLCREPEARNVAETKTDALEAEIAGLIRNFLKTNLPEERIDLFQYEANVSVRIEDAVHSFCKYLSQKVQEHDVEEFIEAFSNKIIEGTSEPLKG